MIQRHRRPSEKANKRCALEGENDLTNRSQFLFSQEALDVGSMSSPQLLDDKVFLSSLMSRIDDELNGFVHEASTVIKVKK